MRCSSRALRPLRCSSFLAATATAIGRTSMRLSRISRAGHSSLPKHSPLYPLKCWSIWTDSWNDPVNQLLRSRRRVRDLVAFFEKPLGLGCTDLRVVEQRAKGFARGDLIGDLLVQDNSDRRIDGVFFFLAAAAQNHACRAHFLALDRAHITAFCAANLHQMLRLGQPLKIVDRAGISAL